MERRSSTGIDPGKISIVSAVKVDKKKLMLVGDELPSDKDRGHRGAVATRHHTREEKCNVCCMAWGALMSTALSIIVSSCNVSLCLIRDKRIEYTLTSAMRQIGWMAIPAALVGTTLHLFLSEAMWSQRRNSWGSAWAKAVIANTICWSALIGTSTAAWRLLLRRVRIGARLFNRYPIPTTRLEARIIVNPNDFWVGMGWTYWALGLIVGQVGFACCAAVAVWQSRVHFMMSPAGPYARYCVPRWRREAIARDANLVLPPRS